MTQTSNTGPGRNSSTPPAQQLTSCGDVSCELLVDPIPRPTPDPIKITLKPKVPTVTFLDHNKPNSKLIMTYAQEILRERGVEVKDQILVKADASVRMPEAMLQSLSQEGGLVLCGISD
ncbi:hypothetical protein H2508_08585 [Parahaliea sp. F7430]|uniref:Uncharacterized protein n=2 Tax=Sediminihaliea albiluteola TaxID=2758564 RepID=A0A7W2TWE7_9GAMM|nr:hypothetical protein [Sediminihaliea albiluteola]